MVSQIIHEMRNPLNCSILMMEQLLKILQQLHPDLSATYLAPSLISSKLLLNLINDILDMSAINAGKFSYTFIQFDIRELVHQIMKLVSLQAQINQITIVSDVEESINSHIVSDPHRLRQIILNLMSNAIKYTKQGSITLTVKRVLDEPKQL